MIIYLSWFCRSNKSVPIWSWELKLLPGNILMSNCLLKSWKCSLCLLWRWCSVCDVVEHLKILKVWKTRSDPVSSRPLFVHTRPIKPHQIANGTSVDEFLHRRTVVFRGRNSHAVSEMIGSCSFFATSSFTASNEFLAPVSGVRVRHFRHCLLLSSQVQI